MKNICLILFIFSFCIKVHSEDWLPNGMIVDKNGSIIHKVEMDKSFNSPKEELTTLAFVAEIEQGRSIVNLSKNSSFKITCIEKSILFKHLEHSKYKNTGISPETHIPLSVLIRFRSVSSTETLPKS